MASARSWTATAREPGPAGPAPRALGRRGLAPGLGRQADRAPLAGRAGPEVTLVSCCAAYRHRLALLCWSTMVARMFQWRRGQDV